MPPRVSLRTSGGGSGAISGRKVQVGVVGLLRQRARRRHQHYTLTKGSGKRTLGFRRGGLSVLRLLIKVPLVTSQRLQGRLGKGLQPGCYRRHSNLGVTRGGLKLRARALLCEVSRMKSRPRSFYRLPYCLIVLGRGSLILVTVVYFESWQERLGIFRGPLARLGGGVGDVIVLENVSCWRLQWGNAATHFRVGEPGRALGSLYLLYQLPST